MAQSAARRSHNPKVVSSILTGRMVVVFVCRLAPQKHGWHCCHVRRVVFNIWRPLRVGLALPQIRSTLSRVARATCHRSAARNGAALYSLLRRRLPEPTDICGPLAEHCVLSLLFRRLPCFPHVECFVFRWAMAIPLVLAGSFFVFRRYQGCQGGQRPSHD